jgi:hypothetical protein
MNYDDAMIYFGAIDVCKYEENYVYQFDKCQGSHVLQEVTIDTEGEYTFSISQKGARMFPENSGYKYSNSRLFLLKIDE